MRGLSGFKIIGYIVVAILLFVVIGLLLLCYKMNGIGQLLVIGKMIPGASTAPLNPIINIDNSISLGLTNIVINSNEFDYYILVL